MGVVLIVDDEKNYLIVLEDLLLDEGYEVITASSAKDALAVLSERSVDVLISDIKMPGMTGIELLDRVKEIDPELPMVLMTAFAEVDQAVAAMKKGAMDHIQKPFDNADLKRAVASAMERRRLSRNIRMVQAPGAGPWAHVIGKSEPMRAVISIAERVSHTSATVLIEGESGVGKELIARGIHLASPRKDAPFISINCAAMTESLLESELFGHEKGSFTGAVSTKAGKFEAANHGSLFLDEVGEMSLNLQAKLLRVLQEQEFQRVGGSKDIRVDVRIIAATNKNLKSLADSGAFRQDLFFRLHVVHIGLPPLRDRVDDLPLLTAHFIHKYSEKFDRRITDVEPGVMAALYGYSWPGNVRELEHILERAVALCRGPSLSMSDLPPDFSPDRKAGPKGSFTWDGKSLTETLDAIEEQIIRDALEKTGNVQAQAAKTLGISRSNLQYKLKKYGLLS